MNELEAMNESSEQSNTSSDCLKQPLKSGKQVGAENVERLRIYLTRLKQQGGKLPSHKGKPDKTAIALASGFSRLTLYNNDDAVALLDSAVNEIGLEDSATTVTASRKDSHLTDKIERQAKRIQHLEQRVQILEAERRELKEKLRQFELIEEVMTANGRRLRP